MLVLKNEQA